MKFKVLTDLDSIIDTRQGTLSLMLKEKGVSFEEIYGDVYDKRILDKFDKPELGITNKAYREAFKKRGLEVLLEGNPSRLFRSLFNIIVRASDLVGKPIAIQDLHIFVNVFPFVIDEGSLSEFKDQLEKSASFPCTVTFINKHHDEITGRFISGFTHVFMYHLLGESGKRFADTFNEQPNPETKLFIPKVFLTESEELNITPGAQLERLAVLWGVLWSVVPLDHKYYNTYTKKEIEQLESKLN